MADIKLGDEVLHIPLTPIPHPLVPILDDSPDPPLTCEYCRNSPATCLLVVDFEYSRVKSTVCEPCGMRSQPDAAKVAKSAWLYALRALEAGQ